MAKKKIRKNTKQRIESVLEKSKYVEQYMENAIISEKLIEGTNDLVLQELEKESGIPLRIKLRKIFNSKSAQTVQKIRIEQSKFELDSTLENIRLMNKVIKEREIEFSNAEQIVKEHEECLKKARKDFEEAKSRLASSKKKKSYLEIQKKEIEKTLEMEREELKIIKTTYLLHPSVTMEQLNKNQLGKFVCLAEDEPIFKVLIIDEVFDINFATRLVTNLPGDFYYKYQHEEIQKAVINYCDMVLNYMAEADEGHKIEPLFYDETIAKILELNS